MRGRKLPIIIIILITTSTPCHSPGTPISPLLSDLRKQITDVQGGRSSMIARGLWTHMKGKWHEGKCRTPTLLRAGGLVQHGRRLFRINKVAQDTHKIAQEIAQGHTRLHKIRTRSHKVTHKVAQDRAQDWRAPWVQISSENLMEDRSLEVAGPPSALHLPTPSSAQGFLTHWLSQRMLSLEGPSQALGM